MVSKILKGDLFYITIILLILSAFLYRGFSSKVVFFAADEVASDLLHFNFPYRDYAAKVLFSTGHIPLWNSYLSSGIPFLAEAQAGIFYPATIILFALVNKFLAFNLLIIISFLITGIGTYYYAREVGAERQGAVFAAIVFSLSGFMVGHLRHVPIITAICLMPVMFLAAEKITKVKNLAWAVVLAVSVAISFFAGHLTTTYTIILTLSIYFFIRLSVEFRKKEKESIKEIVIFIIALVLGIGLSAIQLIPSLELYRYSTRVDESISFNSSPFELKYLNLFVNPFIYGDPSRGTWNIESANYWENIGYIGILPLLISVYVIIKKIKNKAILITLIISFILMLGNNLPLYKLFWLSIPGFSVTRISGRFILFVDFFLAVLAGIGISYFKNKTVLLIISMTVIDLFIFGFHLNSVIPVSYFDSPKIVEFLKKDKNLFRIRSMENFGQSWERAWKESHGWAGKLSAYFDQKENLPPDLNLYYSLASTSIIYGNSGHFTVAAPVKLNSEFDPELYGIMNVKYIISGEQLPGNQYLKLVFQTGDEYKSYIYQNLLFLPRAYFVNDKKQEVKIIKYSEEEILIESNNPNSDTLILSDTYYPGWKAYIDDSETKIDIANYAYRSVNVPAGKHVIKFSFQPESFRLGRGVTLVSGLIILALILLGKRFEKFY